MAKLNKFSYETSQGYTTGYFNVYQSKSGHIYLQMGDGFTPLSKEQLSDLSIDTYTLKDFDHDAYMKAYGLA